MVVTSWNSLTEDQRIALHLLYHDCGGEWCAGRRGQPQYRSGAIMTDLLNELFSLGLVDERRTLYTIAVPGIELIPGKDAEYGN